MTIIDSILEHLREHPDATVAELAELFSAPENTVRRSLSRLQNRGDIEKTEKEGKTVCVVHKLPKASANNYKKEMLTEMCEIYFNDFMNAELYSERVEIGKMICRILEKI